MARRGPRPTFPVIEDLPDGAKVSRRLKTSEFHKQTWRYRCPRGHTTIKYNKDTDAPFKKWGGGVGGGNRYPYHEDKPYYCRTCNHADKECEHEYVVDMTKLETAQLRTDGRYQTPNYRTDVFGFEALSEDTD